MSRRRETAKSSARVASAIAAVRSSRSMARASVRLRTPVARVYRPRNRSSAMPPVRGASSKAVPASASPTRMLRSKFGNGITRDGSDSSASITTDNQSRSSQSHTAVGLISTPKIDVVSTSRRRSESERRSPAAPDSAAKRSRACTRNAPDPHAGSRMRTARTASAKRRASRALTRSPASAARTTRSSAPKRASAASSPAPATRCSNSCGV